MSRLKITNRRFVVLVAVLVGIPLLTVTLMVVLFILSLQNIGQH